MKPAPFEYLSPGSFEEVLETLHQYGTDASLLAGGQSLIAALNFRSMQPVVVVDLNRLPELAYIRHAAGDAVRIGAMTRQRTLELDSTIKNSLPLMHEAVPYVAHVAIRTRGTIGGSLSYADPAAEQPTITTALGARFKAVSKEGDRWIAAEDFFLNTNHNALKGNEALVEIAVPATQPGTGWGFAEIARRNGDRVMMGVAALVTLDEAGVCQAARLVYQNAAPTPRLARGASALLVGHQASPELFAEAAVLAAQKEIDPLTDVHATAAYRRNLAQELTLRTLQTAFERAKSSRG
jgi:CO/xanthine dehydrogenase FAD-binding subunit